MKKGISVLIIAAIVVGSFAFGIWYINKFILPVKAEALFVNLIREKTGYDIKFGHINYMPLATFHLRDVTLYKTADPDSPPITAKAITLSLRLWPLLREKRVVGRIALKDLTHRAFTINGRASVSLKLLPMQMSRELISGLDGVIKFESFSIAAKKPSFSLDSAKGTLTFQESRIAIEKTYFRFNNTVYNAEGLLKGLDTSQPELIASLRSDILSLDTNIIIKEDYLKIDKIDGTFLGSAFNIMGDIKLKPKLAVNLYCESKTDLSDLNKLFSDSKQIKNSLNPSGICDAAIFFNGDPRDIREQEISIKLSSNKVFLYGLALDDLYLDLRMKNGIISTPKFEVSPYNGIFNAVFEADLNDKYVPYAINLVLKDTDLAKFSQDTNLGQRSVSGLLSGKFFLRGLAKSLDTMRGSGWITVAGGRLWEIPILSGISSVLNSPNLKSVVFKEAAGNFDVGDRRVTTNDLTFYSDKANLTITGSADFDGNLDFLLNTNITQELIKGDSEAADIANLFLSEAGNYLGKVKITGTWSKPKYKMMMGSKPVKDIFKKNLGGLLQNKEVRNLLKDILR